MARRALQYKTTLFNDIKLLSETLFQKMSPFVKNNQIQSGLTTTNVVQFDAQLLGLTSRVGY